MSTTEETRRKKRQRRLVGAATLFALFVAILVAGLLLLKFRRADPQLLVSSREQLDTAANIGDPGQRLQLSKLARDSLQKYIDGNGSEMDSGLVLFAAATDVQRRLDKSMSANAAADAFERLESAQLDRCSTNDLLLAGLLFAQCGSLVQADKVVGVALERKQDPRRRNALQLAIDVRYGLAREEEVLKLCRELVDLDPEDFHAWEMQTLIHENQELREQVVEDYLNIIDRFPDQSAPFRIKLVERMIEAGDRTQAEKHFELAAKHALAMLTERPIVYAKLLHLQGKIDEAKKLLAAILESTPEDADALLLRGRIRYEQNTLAGAIEDLAKVIELRPTDSEAHDLISKAYARSGDQAKADKHAAAHELVLNSRVKLYALERQARADPDNRQLREKIAQMYDAIGAASYAERWRGKANQTKNAGS